MNEKLTSSETTGQNLIMLFNDMLRYRCQRCQKELTWDYTVPSKEKVIGYQAICCGVQYKADTHAVTMEVRGNRKLNPFPACKCGHLESDHDRDHGCRNDICTCWRYREREET